MSWINLYTAELEARDRYQSRLQEAEQDRLARELRAATREARNPRPRPAPVRLLLRLRPGT